MSIATFSLVAAVAAGLLAGVAVGAVAARRRSSAAVDDTRPMRPAVTSVDLLVGAVVGGVSYVIALAAAELLVGMTVFGAMSVTYLFAVVGAPLAMALVLSLAVRGRRREPGPAARRAITRPALAVCAAGLLLAPLGVYATHIEPGMLDIDRPAPLAVASERGGTGTVTIGVLTDLQTTSIGARDHAVVDELLATQPDVILLPGDFLQEDDAGFARHVSALRELLGRLSAPGGVFLVGGDVDQPLDRLPQMVEGTSVRYLADEVVRTTVGDRSLTIGGIGLDYDSPSALAVLDELEVAPGDDDIRILLAHRPDPVLDRPAVSRIDLQVSGHTHGGQIAVPFVGPILTLTAVPRHVAAGGLHDLDGHAIYIGRGVGLERGQAPQVRFRVRPNIGVLTLT